MDVHGTDCIYMYIVCVYVFFCFGIFFRMTISILPRYHSADLVFPSSVVRIDLNKKSEVECLAWSGDVLLILTRDGVIKSWNKTMGEERTGTPWTWIESNPIDSNLIAAVSWDGQLKMFGSDFVRETNSLKKEKLLYCAWRMDGQELAVLTRSDMVGIVDCNDTVVQTIVPGVDVYAVVYDCLGQLWVALGGTPGKVQVYAQSEGVYSELKSLTSHAHMTTCLDRTSDGKFVISGGSDALVCLWDTASFVCVKTFAESLSPITTLSVDWANQFVAWGSGGSKDGESVLSVASLVAGAHVLSHITSGPVTRVRWHPTKPVLAFSTVTESGSNTVVSVVSFP